MASRDFLGGFGGRGGEGATAAAEGAVSVAGSESDDIELSLGLSLGGRFGAEAKRPRLERSSSIASVCLASSLNDADPSPAPLPLLRTSSLPTETEEERWRRREMQSQRRLEARRKRVERRSSMGSSASAPGRPAGDAPAAVNGLRLRRSVGSQGSSSLSTREHSSIDVNGVCKSSEASPSASDNTNQNSTLQPTTAATAKPLNSTVTGLPPLRTLGSLTMRTSSTGDIRKIMMEDMPMVSSKVEGPNRRRVDGFLYRYKNGEDVRIVCVCHGSFLTPAEFVKHAGGGDVSNPLRHIVINPSPSVLL